MKSFLDYIAEATGPEGRELSKKVNKHFEGIRGFIGAISGGKANEFQDHVHDGVFSGHDNQTIMNNHGPLKNHGTIRSDDGDDYGPDIHKYIDAVRAHHEYKTDVRDDSEKPYMGESQDYTLMGRPEADVPAEYGRYSQPTNTPTTHPTVKPTGPLQFVNPFGVDADGNRLGEYSIVDVLLRNPNIDPKQLPKWAQPAKRRYDIPGVTPIGR
tara:strand:- start:167 stop:802 length:636 start_codon:yes stop_codon:yes gene_type:complete